MENVHFQIVNRTSRAGDAEHNCGVPAIWVPSCTCQLSENTKSIPTSNTTDAKKRDDEYLRIHNTDVTLMNEYLFNLIFFILLGICVAQRNCVYVLADESHSGASSHALIFHISFVSALRMCLLEQYVRSCICSSIVGC